MDRRLTRDSVIETLYFGGGTPSLLTSVGWTAIFNALTNRIRFMPAAEISIEANPLSVTEETVKLWHDLGINRVSVGVQSLSEPILRFLRRIHRPDQAILALDILAATGHFSVNADLLYGIPGQTEEDVLAGVRGVANHVDHLSAYALSVEMRTPFFRRGITALPPDESAAQYDRLVDSAGRRGLVRYEVSNFSRPGHECRHNQNTWRYGSYVGLGPAAVGFSGTRRYKNVLDRRLYRQMLLNGDLPTAEEEPVDAEGPQGRHERMLLGLRTCQGAALRPGEWDRIRPGLDQDRLTEYFHRSGNRIRIDPRHWLLLDEILVRSGL